MEKRYQIFLSSTFADLLQERALVIQTLMEMDCIPSGMELFPAADEDQWNFIKRVIDDCDYYLLIVGGRYGSLTSEGISYTEREYDYAVSRAMKVIALVHGAPESIPVGKTDLDPRHRDQLVAFRDRVCTGRLVKTWTTASELPGLVALSLSKTMKSHPAVGWIRADTMSADGAAEILRLRDEITELRQRLGEASGAAPVGTETLAQGQDELLLEFSCQITQAGHGDKVTFSDEVSVTWDSLFAYVSPRLLAPVPETDFLSAVDEFAKHEAMPEIARTQAPGIQVIGFAVERRVCDTIKIQLTALGLIQPLRSENGSANPPAWMLTAFGERVMTRMRAIPRRRSGRPLTGSEAHSD